MTTQGALRGRVVRAVGRSGPITVPPESGRRPRQGRLPSVPRIWSSSRSSPRLFLVAGLVTTLLALAVFVVEHGSTPSGAWAPGSSDHISHWSSAVIFWHRGAEIWQRPMYRVCPEAAPTPELAGTAKGDTCTLPERGDRRPLVTNWRQFARPYPPLWLVWSAPEAVLYETTSLSFAAVNKLAILKHLAAAHVLAFLLGIAWLMRPGLSPRGTGAPGADRSVTAAGWLSFLIGSTEAMRWALLGYYDAAAVALVVGGVLLGERRRPGEALLALAGAMALHFRALWYLPLAAVAAAGAFGVGPWAKPTGPGRAPRGRGMSWGDGIRGGVAALLLASSALVLWMLRPTLAALPVTNPLHRRWLDLGNGDHVAFALLLGLALALVVADRAIVLLVALGWQLGFLVLTPQVMPWHSLFLLPLALLARGYRRSELALLMVYVAEAVIVFGNVPLSGDWISSIVIALRSG